MRTVETQSAQNATKLMHSAVSKFAGARKKLHAAREARLTLHNAWRTYLQETCIRWQTYLEDFNDQDQKLEKEISAAEESLQAAKEHLEQTKQEQVGELSTEVENDQEEDEDAKPMTVDSIKEGITEMALSLQKLKNKADESFEAQQGALKKHKGSGKEASGALASPPSMVPFAQAGKGSD